MYILLFYNRPSISILKYENIKINKYKISYELLHLKRLFIYLIYYFIKLFLSSKS